MSVDFSDTFVASAGTITIDIPRRLVLLLYYTPKKEYLLPKGRKEAGETLGETAVRETYEESGHRCSLYSRTTTTPAPLAVQQRVTDGKRKVIFFFIATADSSIFGAANTQQEGEEFESVWVGVDEAVERLSYADDARVVERALDDLRLDLDKGLRDMVVV